MRAFGHLFTGAMMLVDTKEKLESHMGGIMNDFMHVIETEVIAALDLELAELLVLTFNDVMDCLQSKAEKGLDVTEFT